MTGLVLRRSALFHRKGALVELITAFNERGERYYVVDHDYGGFIEADCIYYTVEFGISINII